MLWTLVTLLLWQFGELHTFSQFATLIQFVSHLQAHFTQVLLLWNEISVLVCAILFLFFQTNRWPVYEVKLVSFENEMGNKSHWDFSEFPVRVPTTVTEQLPGFKKWLCWSIYKAGKALWSNLLIKSPRLRKTYDQESHMYINCFVAWNPLNPCWQGCTFKYVYL